MCLYFPRAPVRIEKLPFVQPILDQMGVGLCGGNLHVFREIGTQFARFGVAFAGLAAPNATALSLYLSGFTADQAQLAQAMVMTARGGACRRRCVCVACQPSPPHTPAVASAVSSFLSCGAHCPHGLCRRAYTTKPCG